MTNDRKITVIPPTPRFYSRVGIYCRVSCRSQEQLDSLATQASYLTRLVDRKVGWHLSDIFLDVKPGSSSTDRNEFQRMLSDCRDGKFDIILTKSISRFGRNTVETLAAINEMRSKRVEIIFEMEEISTNDPASSLYISILEGVAQEENIIRGDNIRIGIKHKVENGTSSIYSRICYGYSFDKGNDIRIVDKEAEVVQSIFSMYLEGRSIIGIKRQLEGSSIKSPTGNEVWCKRSIGNILFNEKYTGDVLVFKTYNEGYPATKRKSNKDGKHDQFVSISNNPVIISKEMFEEVQKERQRRSNIEKGATGPIRKSSRYSSKKAASGNDSLSTRLETNIKAK